MRVFRPTEPCPLTRALLLLAALALGCTPNDPPGLDDSTSEGSDTSDEGTADESTGAPAPTCGDAVIEGDEVCDDGELNGLYDQCSADCSGPGLRCGDGQVTDDEVCDDGNELDDDQCLSDCSGIPAAEWVWIETSTGTVRGVTTDARGITTAVGAWGGDEVAGDQGLVRRFDLLGTVVYDSDPPPATDTLLHGVHGGPDGAVLAFGVVGGDAWLHTLTGDTSDDELFEGIGPLYDSGVGAQGWAAASSVSVRHQRFDGTSTTAMFPSVSGIAYEADGTILTVIGSEVPGGQPSLTRLDADLQVVTSVPLSSEFIDSTFSLAPTADGGVLLSGVQSSLPSTQLVRRYDADLDLVWSSGDQVYRWVAIAEVDGEVVVAGTYRRDTSRPIVAVLDDDGEVAWGTELPLTELGYTNGDFYTVWRDPQGGVVAGGEVYLPGQGGGLESGYPVVARFDPAGG